MSAEEGVGEEEEEEDEEEETDEDNDVDLERVVDIVKMQLLSDDGSSCLKKGLHDRKFQAEMSYQGAAVVYIHIGWLF